MVSRNIIARLLLVSVIMAVVSLGTYFAMPFHVQYELWFGLIAAVAAVAFAVWLAIASRKRAALEQTGVLALAQITGLAETAMRIGGSEHRPQAMVNLHIAGPGFAFDGRQRVDVDITKQAVLTRGKLVVLVDPTTHDFDIHWQASGLINGVVPAQFASAEDNKTYDLSGQAGPLMEILQIYKTNNIPISGTVDLRSYPAVRQQVMAVVRRAAAQQQPAAAGVGAAAPTAAQAQASVAQRLQDLEALHKSGAVSAEEYASKRTQIIADI
jgi:hypothetical protein